MHPQQQFGIPTSKNIGGMQRTGIGTEGLTDGRADGGMDSAITICLLKVLWGIKTVLLKKVELMIAQTQCVYTLHHFLKPSHFGIKMNVEMFPKI